MYIFEHAGVLRSDQKRKVMAPTVRQGISVGVPGKRELWNPAYVPMIGLRALHAARGGASRSGPPLQPRQFRCVQLWPVFTRLLAQY
jgi:hypothetical protein